MPVPPGSAPDFLSRIFGAALQQRWGQPVIVDNRPGGSQNIGAELVARAKPDGYTLLVAPPPPIALNKVLYPNLKFDPERFAPVTIMAAASAPTATTAATTSIATTAAAVTTMCVNSDASGTRVVQFS